MGKNETIDSVVKIGLCTGCGTCAGICPVSAIEMVKNDPRGIYLPKLCRDNCNQCGNCLESCPGHSVDFRQLNSAIFGKQPENILLGNYSNCYTGYASNYDIRYNSSSGGMITALLIFALEQGIIDGALVTKMSQDNPLEPQPFIARTIDDIISASKSKYCPVPANIALQTILEQDGRFAVVGLPCHIHGIRKAEEINKRLRDRVVLHLGIFCGSAPTFLWTEFLLRRKGIKKEEIVKLDYRGEGWPGRMSVHLRNGAIRSIPYGEAGSVGKYCHNSRYTLCCDLTAELADISFGDAWLPEFAEDKVGRSIIICRSKQGEKILKDAASHGELKLDGMDSEKVIQSQNAGLYLKKKVIVSSFALARLCHTNIPFYNTDLLKPNTLTYLSSLSLHLGMWVTSKRCLWDLLSAYASLRGLITKVKIRIQKLFD